MMDGSRHSSNKVENGAINDLVLPSLAEQSKLLSDFRALQGKIGILGGTFDPIQNGHLALAEEAMRVHKLDAVIFIPASHNPLKGHMPVASDAERLYMILEAIKDKDGLFVSALELNRSGDSFTIDTVKQIGAELQPNSQLFLIMGADNISSLPKWKEIDQILNQASIVISARPGTSLDQLSELRGILGSDQVSQMKRSALVDIREDISSSEIRAALARGDNLLKGLVPEAVEEFLLRTNIYSVSKVGAPPTK